MLRTYLTDEGFKVSDAADGDAMRAILEREKIDAVLLDLMMPGEDGLSLARHIRLRSAIPIIMLTGKGELIDRVVGLESGADDYITKPFELREVLARLRAVLRRAAPLAGASPKAETHIGATRFRFDRWRFDLERRELSLADGEVIPLTAGEFELLKVFVANSQQVLSRDRLLDLVKGRDWASFDRAVDTQVGRLRKKIEPDPSEPTLIKTVRGGGYVFAMKVEPQ